MKYVFALIMMVVPILSTKLQEPVKPCLCGFIYKPVCGSNGVTYSNLCGLECAQNENPALSLAYHEACKTDNKEMNAEIKAKSRGATLQASNAMKTEPETGNKKHSCFCSREYRPVCASNGVTYNNPCEFNCAKDVQSALELRWMGSCVENNNINLI